MDCIHCSNTIAIARVNIGYTTCLQCGQKEAKQHTWTVAPAYNKGAYQVINKSSIKDIGR